MNLLMIPSNYPYPAAPHIGAQNERCAQILHGSVNRLVVLSPRPFTPSFMAVRLRWKRYASIPFYTLARGIEVYRPASLVLPRVAPAIWKNDAAYYRVRPLARALHQKHCFNGILSFDLLATGGLAWRLGRNLGIPASGWATGGDVRSEPDSSLGRSLKETLTHLDLVFYQSRELLSIAADFLKTTPARLESSGRHIVLSRGVIEPQSPPGAGVRAEVRQTLGISRDDVMVLYLG